VSCPVRAQPNRSCKPARPKAGCPTSISSPQSVIIDLINRLVCFAYSFHCSIQPKSLAEPHGAMASRYVKREPLQTPPSFAATSSSILAATHRIIESTRSVQDSIVATVSPETATFENVLVPLVQAENLWMNEGNILGFYRFASADEALREASSQSNNLMEAFLVTSRMREDIFALVDAVHVRESSEAIRLDPESKHLLNRIYGEFIKNGLKLQTSAERERLGEIQMRINTLANEFERNVSQATTGGVWFALGELPGFPDDELAGLERGTGLHEGEVLVTFKVHQRTVLRFVTNRESRMRMYVAQANRCNENIPLFREVTVLRDEAARLLGYPSHAALAVEDKMARNTQTVAALLYSLRDGLTPGGLRELEKYKKLKQADVEEEGKVWDGHYFISDQPFYSRKLLVKEYTVDHGKIAEYFPLETTVDGMLGMFQQLFSLVFTELSTKDSKIGDCLVWNDEVRGFSVWDNEAEGGGFLGYMYLDLYSRDFKSSSASDFNLIPVR
jgi:metallopeptidase MepB